MHKFLTKIATLSVGLAMAVGVGVAVGSKSAKVSAADDTIVFNTTNSEITATGSDKTITQSGVTLTFSSISAIGSNFVQNAKNATVTSTEIPGVITSIKVYDCATTSTKTDGGFTVYGGVSASAITTEIEAVAGLSSTASDHTITFSGSYTFFKIVNGSARVLKHSKIDVVYSAQSGKDMRIQNEYHSAGPFEATYGDTSEYKYALAWDIDGNTALNSGCSWSVSDDSVIDYYTDGYTWLNWKPKNVGTTTITVSHDGFKDASTTITVVPGTLDTVVVSGSMSKTSYYVGESWSPAGLVATANYDSGYSYDATEDVAWTYSPASPALGVDAVVATATLDSVSGNSASQSVSVTRTNPIQVLYTKTSGASVDVYGYYVGFLDGTGPVIMDGEYGIVIYNKTADVSGYTAGETILHVTGSISIYKGLYEIGSSSISVASGTFDVPNKPVVYSTQGGETADKASRLTTVTGTPAVVSGSFDSDAGTADITMNFTVGSKTVQVFYKKAAQTADAEAFAAIKAAATAAPAQEITIKGFTGWYDGFQVQMNGYVPAAEGYTAEDFSQDLLDQTDAVCADYVSDESKFAEIKTALVAIWSDLASSDKYPSLPSAEKTILAEAERKESGTVVEQAMARYDFLTGKYDLNNFINGRTPIVPAGAPVINADNTLGSSSVITIIVIASLLSVSTIGVCFIIRRRKMY